MRVAHFPILMGLLGAWSGLASAQVPDKTPGYWDKVSSRASALAQQAREALPVQGTVAGWVPDRSSLPTFEIPSPGLLGSITLPASLALPTLASLGSWVPSEESHSKWVPSVDTVRGYIPAAPEFSSWLRSGNLGIGSTVDLRQAIAEGWALVPQDSRWWTDYAVSTVSVGVVVGWASFGCAVVATPGGPVLVALSVAACSAVGADVAERLVRAGYAHAGENLDESALTAGKLTGRILGSIVGFQGSEAFGRMLTFRHYKDYAGYAKHARDLTRASIRPYKTEVAGLRSRGYDIDHVIPVKCGWRLGMLPMEIASSKNLHGLPSSINRSIGAKGC